MRTHITIQAHLHRVLARAVRPVVCATVLLLCGAGAEAASIQVVMSLDTGAIEFGKAIDLNASPYTLEGYDVAHINLPDGGGRSVPMNPTVLFDAPLKEKTVESPALTHYTYGPGLFELTAYWPLASGAIGSGGFRVVVPELTFSVREDWADAGDGGYIQIDGWPLGGIYLERSLASYLGVPEYATSGRFGLKAERIFTSQADDERYAVVACCDYLTLEFETSDVPAPNVLLLSIAGLGAVLVRARGKR